MYGILEATEARIDREANAARAPLAEFGEHIFGDKRDLCGPADELVLLGIALGGHECEVGAAIGGRNGDETAHGKVFGSFFVAAIEDELEAELVHVEAEAAIQIANVNEIG